MGGGSVSDMHLFRDRDKVGVVGNVHSLVDGFVEDIDFAFGDVWLGVGQTGLLHGSLVDGVYEVREHGAVFYHGIDGLEEDAGVFFGGHGGVLRSTGGTAGK